MEQPKWQEKSDTSTLATFKAEAISSCENGVAQETVAEWFHITQSQVSRWLKNEASVMEDETNSHRKLFKKGRKAMKYLQLYDSLFKEFLLAHSKGHIVNFGWLWSKARKSPAEIDPNVEVKHHVIVRFLQFKLLRMRAKQRKKKKHKKEHEL